MKLKICLALILFSVNSYAMDHLTVLLDWYLNPDHATLFIAQQKGFFKANNLDVTLIGPADPSDPPKLVAAGKADIALTYQPQFLEQVDNGLPLIMLGTLINHPLNCLVTLSQSHINHLADLKNKSIGVSGGSLNHVMLSVMLQHEGLTDANVTTINIHYALTQALLAKKVDAVTGLMRNFEVKQIELAGQQVNVFYPEDYGMPSYSELIFVTHKNHRNDLRLPRFLKALKDAQIYLVSHPQEGWNSFANAHQDLNDSLNKSAWFTTIPYFAQDPQKINHQQFMNFAIFMQQQGFISTVKEPSAYFYH